jgi:hypothetical protein
MEILRTVLILALFLSAMTLFGCFGANKNANMKVVPSNSIVENANYAKTNVEELSLLVNVPYEVADEDIVWKENTALKKLTAVMRFSPEDAKKIVDEAAARKPPENVNLPSETWFPAELIAQSEMSGDDTLNGLAFAADSFFQEPFASGRLVRIEGTDYFVLELSAK